MRVTKLFMVTVMTVVILVLNSCSILPKEKEYDTALLVSISETDYEYAYVQRDTLAHTEKVVCLYTSAYSEDYSFDIDGENYGVIYVKLGDYVKTGDLLAELDQSEYKSSITKAEKEVEELQQAIDAYTLQAEIDSKRQEILLQERSEIARITMDSEEAIKKQYETEIANAKMRIEILSAWLEYWNTEVEERRLYASFDGVVTYLKSINPGDISSEGTRIIRVSDDQAALFTATTPYANYFTTGLELTASVDKTDYTVKVINPKEYGKEAKEYEVYLEATGSSLGLSTGDKGTITITIDKKEDILYIPEEAVVSLDGQPVIFCLNNAGVFDYKKITTGFSANGYIEVIDGLSEGNSVIIR